MITLTPFRSYADTYHVLGAGACFVHPTSGNVYFSACEKVDGAHQNLVIYRLVAATGKMETVITLTDGIDSEGFIERGNCIITHTGALVVATSLQLKGLAYDPQKTTGFKGAYCVIPGVDEPWSLSAMESRLLQRIEAIEAQLANVSAGNLSKEDRAALEWTKQVIALD